MKIEKIILDKEHNVSLTTYIHDVSDEMKNVKNRPAILIFPGGGYHFCSDREGEPIALAYAAKGYQAFVLRYSLKDTSVFPKPLRDAEMALKLIRDNADEWGVISNKIAVIGFSAGGHLATAIGTIGKIKPNALILGYPCVLEEGIDEDWPYQVPGTHNMVDSTTPESFIFHTYNDDLVPVKHALVFAAALDKAKIPFDLHIFKNGVHGLSLGNNIVSNGSAKMVELRYQEWFELSVSWLQEVFNSFENEKNSREPNE